MGILELAARRRSIRKFRAGGVTLKDVLRILEAARQAPSGANSQPWRFLVVSDSGLKARIRAAAEEGERRFYERVSGELREWLQARGFSPEKPFLEEAPFLVLVFSQARAPYSVQSTWIAVGYALLAAEEAGLGTLTYTPSDPTRVAEEVDAPEGLRLEVILPIGIPADDKPKEPRLPLSEVCRLNSWDRPCPGG